MKRRRCFDLTLREIQPGDRGRSFVTTGESLQVKYRYVSQGVFTRETAETPEQVVKMMKKLTDMVLERLFGSDDIQRVNVLLEEAFPDHPIEQDAAHKEAVEKVLTQKARKKERNRKQYLKRAKENALIKAQAEAEAEAEVKAKLKVKLMEEAEARAKEEALLRRLEEEKAAAIRAKANETPPVDEVELEELDDTPKETVSEEAAPKRKVRNRKRSTDV